MSNMWRLSISGIHELMNDPECGVQWESITPKGQGALTGKISHHKPAVFGHTVVVFGGNNEFDNATDAFEYDTNKNTWHKMKQTGDVPKPRDDHSLSQIDGESFIIFGGFVEGSRVNEAYVGKKNGQTIEWSMLKEVSPVTPCIRASHSSVVYNGKFFVFGGQDDDTNKLNDLWELDLKTHVWKQIELPEGSTIPTERSGQTSDLYNGQMYIFGGILELTKELNDLLIFDFKSGKFTSIGGDQEDPAMGTEKRTQEETASPGLKKKMTMIGNQGMSPSKLPGQSPSKTGKSASPSKLTAKARRAGKKPGEEETTETKESGLASPTSISM